MRRFRLCVLYLVNIWVISVAGWCSFRGFLNGETYLPKGGLISGTGALVISVAYLVLAVVCVLYLLSIYNDGKAFKALKKWMSGKNGKAAGDRDM